MFCVRRPNFSGKCHAEPRRTFVYASKNSKVLLKPLSHEQSSTRHSHLGVWRILCRIPVTRSTFKVQRETYESSSVRWQTLLGVISKGTTPRTSAMSAAHHWRDKLEVVPAHAAG